MGELTSTVWVAAHTHKHTQAHTHACFNTDADEQKSGMWMTSKFRKVDSVRPIYS